ncbi:MAG TPA: dihydrolipoyl dehydrogenase [Candidatus Ozemobacteraceae bacterium]|nr:dihydrolipoyl dehydrogenase [Candidatus Ozemobacteraceae bacterium]
MNHFDLVVIGAGPAGYPLAGAMARHGWKVAVVERDASGGTCLNRGCIPTKALLASSRLLHQVRHAEQWGVKAETIGFDWTAVMNRKTNVLNGLRQGIDKMLQAAGTTMFKGTASLLPGKRVRVETGENPVEISADRICLATGSVPAVPAGMPSDRTLFWTSDEALAATAVPESLLIVGGGVIGLEFGQVFATFGAKVTIVEMMPQILPGLDTATAKRLLPVFKKAGLEIFTGQKVEGLGSENGQVVATIAGQKRVFAKALLAMGRRPDLSVLVSGGVTLRMDGRFIGVDEKFETSEAGVFAVGDAIPGPMLAHKATADAIALADHWRGRAVSHSYDAVPACVYTHPEIAWVGLSEEEAKAKGLQFTVGRSLFSANGRAVAAGDADGQVKTMTDENGHLLGAVIWGPEACNLIVEPTMLLELKITAGEARRVIHPHPTLSEAFAEAMAAASGDAVHG